MLVTHQARYGSSYYKAYLVRLWRDDADEPWRGSAQSVQTGELVRFATLQELFTFLEIRTQDVGPAEETPPPPLGVEPSDSSADADD